MTTAGPARDTGPKAPGCLTALLIVLVIPAALTYLLITLSLRQGAAGGDTNNRGTADVTDCHPAGRLLDLVQECAARNVVLGVHYPAGPTHSRNDVILITRHAVHGQVAIVEKCQPVRGFVASGGLCTLYPASFPRSVWWSWLPYFTIPIALFGYLGVRASADNRRYRRSTGRSRASLYMDNLAARTTTQAIPTTDPKQPDPSRKEQP